MGARLYDLAPSIYLSIFDPKNLMRVHVVRLAVDCADLLDDNGSPIGTDALAKAFAYHAGLSAVMLD
jgi:hypothetical protein